MFEFSYMLDNIKYVYGFAATKTAVVKEYLYHSPKGQKAMAFSRNGQDFEFREGPDKKKRELISETVTPNQLYFSVACTMNEKACMSAMRWFREQLLFSCDYTDLSDQLIEHSENPNMLQAIKRYAIEADLGIQIYFVDKDKTSGSSSLYSISEFSTTTNENIRKGYLLGKYGAAPDLNIEV